MKRFGRISVMGALLVIVVQACSGEQVDGGEEGEGGAGGSRPSTAGSAGKSAGGSAGKSAGGSAGKSTGGAGSGGTGSGGTGSGGISGSSGENAGGSAGEEPDPLGSGGGDGCSEMCSGCSADEYRVHCPFGSINLGIELEEEEACAAAEQRFNGEGGAGGEGGDPTGPSGFAGEGGISCDTYVERDKVLLGCDRHLKCAAYDIFRQQGTCTIRGECCVLESYVWCG